MPASTYRRWPGLELRSIPSLFVSHGHHAPPLKISIGGCIRGRDERGQDLVMARDYIGHGIRARAQDLVTLELGPETEL